VCASVPPRSLEKSPATGIDEAAAIAVSDEGAGGQKPVKKGGGSKN
jgi:hypothetical protein